MLDDVDWFFACHLGCKLPSGKLAAEATGFLFSRKLDVTFAGQAAHAAMGPQEGRNALLAAATAVLGLHALARHADQITHVNVGRLVAEGARNIVADRADLQMEVRGQTQQSLDLMERRALEVLQGAAAMQGVTVTTTDMGGTIGAVSSPAALRVVSDAAARVAGIGDVLPGWPLGGGEDAPFMMQRVQQRGGQAAYFILGSDIPAVHHAADFDIDERALDLGVHVFEQIAAQVLGTT
jgi:aminobenzoyl-glutamate utilization protein A